MAGRPVHEFRVLDTERLTPHMVRLVLGGNGSDGEFGTFSPGAYADSYVKLVFVDPDVDVAGLPRPLTLDSFDALAPEARPAVRTYTVRRVDHDRARISVDFVVHGGHGGAAGGVAARWAAAATVGQPAYLMGPGGAYTPDPAADWHLLAGDESALPAIGAALDALPADARAQVFIEVGGPDDEVALATPAGAQVTWVHRAGAPTRSARTAAGTTRH